MKLVSKGLVAAVVGALTLGVSGCDSLLQTLGIRTGEATIDSPDDGSGERIGTQVLNTEGNSNVLTNSEAGIELTLPSTWEEDLRLHDSAELQASDPNQQLFIVVVAEDDESLLRFGLAENAERYRKLLISKLQADGRFVSQSATDVAFIGDNFANQYEIRGAVQDNTPVVYLHTTVVSEQRYYQIVAWTTEDQYAFYQSDLQTITDSFRETDS